MPQNNNAYILDQVFDGEHEKWTVAAGMLKMGR